MNLVGVLYILLGGAIGTGFRFGIGTLLNARIEKPIFPYATFLINLIGSFLIGLLVELFEMKVPVTADVRAAVLIGVLGGFTTFSSFSLETFVLIQTGRIRTAMLYSVGSIILGLLSVWFGVQVAKQI